MSFSLYWFKFKLEDNSIVRNVAFDTPPHGITYQPSAKMNLIFLKHKNLANAVLSHSPPQSGKAECWSSPHHRSAPFRKHKCHTLELDKMAQKKVVASHSLAVHFPLGQRLGVIRFRGAAPLPFDAYKEERVGSTGVVSLLVSKPGGDERFASVCGPGMGDE